MVDRDVVPFAFSLQLLAKNFLTFRLAIYLFTPATETVNITVVIRLSFGRHSVGILLFRVSRFGLILQHYLAHIVIFRRVDAFCLLKTKLILHRLLSATATATAFFASIAVWYSVVIQLSFGGHSVVIQLIRVLFFAFRKHRVYYKRHFCSLFNFFTKNELQLEPCV